MRVLADFHHHALWESYNLTFGDRFGWEVYRPIGMEWFDEGIWQFEKAWHGDAVAHQYLDRYDSDTDRGDWSERPDRKNPGRTFRMVSVEQARALGLDFVISSVPDNEPGFYGFAREVRASFGIQVGNQGQMSNFGLADFALVSSTMPYTVPVPHVIYHQEFSTELFRYEPPTGFGPVASFVNCFPETPEYPRFKELAEYAPDLNCEVYGSYGSRRPDELACGDIEATPDIADAMRAAGVIYHAKYWSDGFGHVIHNAFAVGRPVIGSARYYVGKLAEPLWVEGVTSFDIDRHGLAGTAEKVRELRDNPDVYLAMCEAAAKRFREVVDFDEDAEKVRAVMENVAVPV